MIMEYGSRVLLAVITLAIGWWLINKVTQKLGGLLALRNADLALQGFISSLANIMLKVLLIVSVASMIGVETTSFVAAIGAAGLAIGLALQGSLANFAGGVLILLFRPFRIGDWIEAQVSRVLSTASRSSTPCCVPVTTRRYRAKRQSVERHHHQHQPSADPQGGVRRGWITKQTCRKPVKSCWTWPRIRVF
jgi:hypothetical protein